MKIEAAVSQAIEYKLFLLLFGDSGFGKSYTYRDLARKSENTITHYEIKASDKPIHLYNNVIKAFPNYENYRSSSLKWCIEKASDLYKGNNPQSLLIIDEANQFKPGMLNYIREFRDKTEFSCGLVISGPTEFYDELSEWKDTGVKGMNEFWTRKDEIVIIDQCSEEDMENICFANGIKEANLIDDMIVKSEGNFRGLKKQIEKHYRDQGYQIIREAA